MTEQLTTNPNAHDVAAFGFYTDEELRQTDAPFDVFEADMAHIARQKEAFFASGCTINPNLIPSGIDMDTLVDAENKLHSFEALLPIYIGNDDARQIYHWRLREDIGLLRMVQATLAGDSERFRRYNYFVYGAPDKEIYRAVGAWFVQEAEAALSDPRPEVAAAAATVLASIRPGERGDREALIPDEATFQAVRANNTAEAGFLGRLMGNIPIPDVEFVDETIGDPIIRHMLDNMGFTDAAIEDATSWSVGATYFRRPATYHMTRQEFIEFVGHEFRHVEERRQGLVSELTLMATGIDRYEIGNEGRGVITEEVTNEHFEDFTNGYRWHELLARHYAVSLSCGLNGRTMDFVETFAVVRNALLVFEASSPQNQHLDEAIEKANNNAWDILWLTYGGTSGSGVGGGWRRPMIYLQGSVGIWERAKDDPGVVDLGDQGKINPVNERHVGQLHALRIIESGQAAT